MRMSFAQSLIASLQQTIGISTHTALPGYKTLYKY